MHARYFACGLLDPGEQCNTDLVGAGTMCPQEVLGRHPCCCRRCSHASEERSHAGHLGVRRAGLECLLCKLNFSNLQCMLCLIGVRLAKRAHSIAPGAS